MKKILYSITLIMFVLFPFNVFAEGYISVSPNVLTIEQGSSKTFTISAYNTIGDVSISSNNTNIATVNTNEWSTGMVEEKDTKSGSITVTGINIGTTTITLNIDAATFDSEDLLGQTKTITVNVIEKTTTTTTTNKINNSSTTTTTTKKTKSTYFSKLEIEGYNLEFKKEQLEYQLNVGNDVDKINIKYELEDESSTVKINGNYDLIVGENKIEYIISNEEGETTTYVVKINREKINDYVENNESIILEELKKDIDSIKVKLNMNDSNKVISTAILESLKNNKKDIIYNIYNNNKTIYSFKIKGANITSTNEINFGLKFESDYENNIKNIIKDRDNIILNFEYTGILPKNTEIVLYDIDMGDKLHLYYYNSNKDELEYVEEYKLNDKSLVLNLDLSSSEYVLLSKKVTNNTNILFIIGTILDILIIVLIVLYIILNIRKTKKNKV